MLRIVLFVSVLVSVLANSGGSSGGSGMIMKPAEPCTAEITTVADYHAKKATFDLIVDVRAYNEYVGDGDASCNAGKANKCNMGHDPHMWMLTNADRSDKAVLYKVNGTHTVDPKIVSDLKACYGEKVSTMKILVSCHSGGRSYELQQALVGAGFKCGNIYNFKPGADGLFKADPATLIKNNTMKGAWTCSAAKVSAASSTGSSVAAASTLSLSAFSIVTAYLGMVNVFF